MTRGPALADFDPAPFLKGLVALRRLTGMYPHGHPVVAQKVTEVFQSVAPHLGSHGSLYIDLIEHEPHVNGEPRWGDGTAMSAAIEELRGLATDSIELRPGLQPDELRRAAEFIGTSHQREGSTIADLSGQGVTHIAFRRIAALDTRWQTPQLSGGPAGPLHPAYAEALTRAEETFETVASGRALDPASIRSIVQLLIGEVARSSAALAQILTLKDYENLTYCHSINVATLSWMVGRQLRLDDEMMVALVECALLHDVGKTRVPLAIVQKPGALDRAERSIIESHTTFGAEILAETAGVHALAPTVALEHHRGVNGSGYPDLGDGVVPHVMSQIVSVADIYEALTGARSYRQPMKPDQACLVLAREAGPKLNTAFVKAFVSAVTFFPIGSLVRTSREEIGVVVRTDPRDPLHPVIVLTDETFADVGREIDTTERDPAGAYVRHIAETLAGRPQSPELLAQLSSTVPEGRLPSI